MLSITREWQRKLQKKKSPYEHSFVGILKGKTLFLASTTDQSIIKAVRTSKL